MSILASAWALVKSLFTKKTLGVIFRILLDHTKSSAMTILTNADIQKFAYNTAIDLRQDESMTTLEKAKEFNIRVAKYIKELGLVSTTSLINTLRELAVQAIKVQATKNEIVAKEA